MDPTVFDATFEGICVLNNTEGPSRNVFEPKFAARDQMLTLKVTLLNVLIESRSLVAQAQLCRCLVFIGGNMIETDEEKEGFSNLLTAYALVCSTIEQELIDPIQPLKEADLQQILLAESHPLVFTSSSSISCDEHDRMQFAFEYLESLNAICVHLANCSDTKFRLDDARKLLHRAEVAFSAWNAWFNRQPTEDQCSMNDLQVGDDGKLIRAEGVADRTFRAMQTRHRCEGCYTTTIFLLSQVYGQKGDAHLASKYCHRTLARQLLTRQEFSRKEWAKNAIMLSAFFDSIHDFGKGLHCLQAGQHMMPKEPADEETLGVVAWGLGRHYLNVLTYYAEVAKGEETLTSATSFADEWWSEFQLPIPPASVSPHVTSFDAARDVFKEGNQWLKVALTYYVVDGCCTDHIQILQDMANLYKQLIVFEADVERRVAMHQRRIAPLEKLPDELNFQSYATVIRQLLFDLGDMYSDILDLRIMQKKAPDGKYGKPLSESKLNQLSLQSRTFFERFCKSFKDPKTDTIPKVLEEESRMPFFRALMRIAHLQSKWWYKTPREEYDGIATTIERYNDALQFAAANKLGPESAQEVRLAQEMVQLLPGKQRDVYRQYAGKSN